MTDIYSRAITNGCEFESTCVDINIKMWDRLMKGATRADRKKVVKIAFLAGVIDEWQYKQEANKPWYNPYNHYKTKTHIVYVNSAIEHFIKVN
jgi:hypothetical protein